MRITKAAQQSFDLETLAARNDLEGARKLVQSREWIEGKELSRALGYACRYGSAEMAELLLDAGATFEYRRTPWMRKVNGIADDDAVSDVIERYLYFLGLSDLDSTDSTLEKSDEQYKRLHGKPYRDVLRLMSERAKDAEMDLDTLLFFAILAGDDEAVAALAELGVTELRGWLRKIASDTTRSALTMTDDGYAEVIVDAALYSDDPERILAALSKAAGGPVRFRPTDLPGRSGDLPEDESTMYALVAYTTLGQHMSKELLLRHSVSHSFVRVVQWAAEHGWIRTWGAYDKLQKLAQNEGASEEVCAVLLQQQQASGKKPPRQTGPDTNPFSAKSLAAVWSTKIMPDSTIQITSYKGHTLPDVIVPDTMRGRPVTSIEPSAFTPSAGRTKQIEAARQEISSIVIPGTVSEIPAFMMSDSVNLKRVEIREGVKRIQDGAFGYCEGLEEVVLPESLEEIGEGAFARCTKLADVTGLARHTRVARGAFRNTAIPEDPDTGLLRLGERIVGTVWTPSLGMLEVADAQQAADCAPHLADLPPIIMVKGAGNVPAGTPELSGVHKGDIAHLGHFPDDESLEFRPIPWICLKRDGDHALLLTRDIIAAVPSSWIDVDEWHDTRLAQWLNGAFLQTVFSDAERSIMRPEHKEHDTTKQTVFLLSRKQVERLMPSYGDRRCESTVYAERQYRRNGWRLARMTWATSDYSKTRGVYELETLDEYGSFCLIHIFQQEPDAIYAPQRAIGLRPAVWCRC